MKKKGNVEDSSFLFLKVQVYRYIFISQSKQKCTSDLSKDGSGAMLLMISPHPNAMSSVQKYFHNHKNLFKLDFKK